MYVIICSEHSLTLIKSDVAGSSSPFIYVSESCLECERVRAACERLGAVEAARAGDVLPPPQSPPAPPSYLVTTPFDGELFDAAHRAKYRSVIFICYLKQHPVNFGIFFGLVE